MLLEMLSTLLRGDSSSRQKEAAAAEVSSEIFSVMEALVLVCGPMLSITFRERLESILGESLGHLLRGGFFLQHNDRKLRRQQQSMTSGGRTVDSIRHSIELQRQLLSLCAVDVSTPRSDGQLPATVSLLRNACSSCLGLQSDLRMDSIKVFGMLEALVHPTAVAIPTVDAVQRAHDFSKQSQLKGNSHHAASSAASNESAPEPLTASSRATQWTGLLSSQPSTMLSEVVTPGATDPCIRTNEEEGSLFKKAKVDDDTRITEVVMEPDNALPTKVTVTPAEALVVTQAPVPPSVMRQSKESDKDDSDDDLPDIVMDD